jgi:hypothetical protein
MKKKLNVDAVTNELESGSVFFQRRPQRPSASESEQPPAEDAAQTNQSAVTVLRQTVKPENRKTGDDAQRLSGNRGAEVPDLPALDLRQEVSQKDTVWLSDAEADVLDELKKEFRRKFDLKAPKLDLMRCAVYALVDDYRRRGENSIVYQQITKKRRKE